MSISRPGRRPDLGVLRQYVEDQSADDLRYALAPFSSHRGCGKIVM
jgi:hypothetical protein